MGMLSSIGIKPDGIVGHSLGEVGCGYADGCLTAEEAVLAAQPAVLEYRQTHHHITNTYTQTIVLLLVEFLILVILGSSSGYVVQYWYYTRWYCS